MLDTKKIMELRQTSTLFLSSLRELKSETDKELSEMIYQFRDLRKKLKIECKISPKDIHYLDTPHLNIKLLGALKYMIFRTSRKEIKEKLGYSNHKADTYVCQLRRWIKFTEEINEKKIQRHREIFNPSLLKNEVKT